MSDLHRDHSIATNVATAAESALSRSVAQRQRRYYQQNVALRQRPEMAPQGPTNQRGVTEKRDS